MENDIPLFPVTETIVGTIREESLLILNQARVLVQQIQSRLAMLETSPPPNRGQPTH